MAGRERGCCINQKQSRNSCLWPGNTSVIPGTGKGDVNMYIFIFMYIKCPQNNPPQTPLDSLVLFHRH